MRIFVTHSEHDSAAAGEILAYLRSSNFAVVQTPRLGAVSDGRKSDGVMSWDLCLAVLGASPDAVMFEIGLAAGAGIPLLIVALPGANIPEALSGQPYVPLRGDRRWDLHSLAVRLVEIERTRLPSRLHFRGDRCSLGALESHALLSEFATEHQFLRVVSRLLEQRGFVVEDRTDRSADLVLRNADSNELMLVEVKRQRGHGLLPIDVVHQVAEQRRLCGAKHAMIVSDAGFTTAARAFAEEVGVRLAGIDELMATSTAEEVLLGLDKVRRLEGVRQFRKPSDRLPSDTAATAPHGETFAGDPAQLARALVRIHWELAQAFSPAFRDPTGLRLLLEVFALERTGRRPTVSELCIASGLPTTLALRHIASLETAGALRRHRAEENPVQVLISISDSAADAVANVLVKFTTESIEGRPREGTSGRTAVP